MTGKTTTYSPCLPNGKLLLKRLSLTEERLLTGSKVAVPIKILKAILEAAVSKLPFDEEFYLSNYPDIREAYDLGKLTDLKRHYIETGYFEGRIGSTPDVDEEFYKEAYPDVAAAIVSGEIQSARDHYFQIGATEGRFPNEEIGAIISYWLELFGRS